MFPKSTRILIIDDLPVVRAYEKKHLTNLGYQNIFEASDGQESMEILQNQTASHEPIELILCDWHMPNLDGVEFLKEMKKDPAYREVPFIMLTGDPKIFKTLKNSNVGVAAYIPKPFNINSLRNCFARLYKDLSRKQDNE